MTTVSHCKKWSIGEFQFTMFASPHGASCRTNEKPRKDNDMSLMVDAYTHLTTSHFRAEPGRPSATGVLHA
eukprot:scaffold238282_cov15-Prasinocladus_malaysianus.AAC.1